MSLKLENFQYLTITSETVGIPPPYSHNYQFVIQLSEGILQVEYQLNYTERETLTEEEILEEGFTLHDDYDWKGKLPAVWQEAIIQMLRQTTRLSPQPKAGIESMVMLQIRDEAGDLQQGIPDNLDAWTYFLQEMAQAVFESSRKERPLVIKYLEITGPGRKLEVVIQPSFSNRQLAVEVYENGKKQTRSYPWANLKPLLKAVYLPDYEESKARSQQPVQAGQYIDPGEGVWYELYQGVTNPGKKYDAVGAMEKEIKVLL